MDGAPLVAHLDEDGPQVGLRRHEAAAHAQRAQALALDLQVERMRAEPIAQPARLAHRASRGDRERLRRGVEQQLRDRIDERLHERRPFGGAEEPEPPLPHGAWHFAHAILAHGGEDLAERAYALTTCAAGATEMLLDATPRGLVETLLEEIECHAGVEVSVTSPFRHD